MKCIIPSSKGCKDCAYNTCFPDLIKCTGIPEN